jgi:hypothetical protein
MYCQCESSASTTTVEAPAVRPWRVTFIPFGTAPNPSGPRMVARAAKAASPSGVRTPVPAGISAIHFGLPYLSM